VERVGLVALRDERLRAELRRYGGPFALLAAATVAVVVVRATTAHGSPASVPHVAPRPAAPTPARPASAHRFVTVSSGDTLGSIAAQAHTSVARLLALNPGVQPTALHVGQRLRIS
jgi:LysM repeat protein